jgi:hypothetical protein
MRQKKRKKNEELTRKKRRSKKKKKKRKRNKAETKSNRRQVWEGKCESPDGAEERITTTTRRKVRTRKTERAELEGREKERR